VRELEGRLRETNARLLRALGAEAKSELQDSPVESLLREYGLIQVAELVKSRRAADAT
jgi:hypothetical protein